MKLLHFMAAPAALLLSACPTWAQTAPPPAATSAAEHQTTETALSAPGDAHLEPAPPPSDDADRPFDFPKSSHAPRHEVGSNILGIKLDGVESHRFYGSSEPNSAEHAPSGEHTDEAAPEDHASDNHAAEVGMGVAAFYERTLVPRWLSVEVCIPVIFSAEGASVPLEALVKKPFELSHKVEAFVGVGPALLVLHHHEPASTPGIVASVGTFLWVTPQFGIDLETDYTLLFEEYPLHELALAAGPALRF